MKPKRQIIKTRPQQPYIIARIVVVILAIVIAVVTAWHYYHQTVRAGHSASVQTAPVLVLFTPLQTRPHRPTGPDGTVLAGVGELLKEGYVPARIAPTAAAWEHVCS